MRFFVDHSKPLNSIDHCWHEAFYDGKSDSDILQIFGHWHKVDSLSFNPLFSSFFHLFAAVGPIERAEALNFLSFVAAS